MFPIRGTVSETRYHCAEAKSGSCGICGVFDDESFDDVMLGLDGSMGVWDVTIGLRFSMNGWFCTAVLTDCGDRTLGMGAEIVMCFVFWRYDIVICV